MLSLKLAKKEDAAALAVFFEELFLHSTYRNVTTYSKKDVEGLISKIAENSSTGVTIMLLSEGTLIGAMICSSMKQVFNSAEKTAVELGFWITPEHRSKKALKEILSAYRYWAKRTGCSSIMYGKLTSDSSVENYIIRKIR